MPLNFLKKFNVIGKCFFEIKSQKSLEFCNIMSLLYPRLEKEKWTVGYKNTLAAFRLVF